MKIRLTVLLLSLAFASTVVADEPAAPPIATDSTKLTDVQLEQLLSPIALYPDALIAIILPAATAPADIVLAARYLKDSGDPEEVSSRSWDESVKSLVHYAEVVKWMDDNLAWTKQVGEAFRDQSTDVMQAIQRLRAQARAAGTLIDSPQQQVLVDSDLISIVPAQANYLYVPYYDPAIVYAPPANYYSTTFITYSSPFAVGAWLNFDCDWRHRTVWTGDRRRWTVRNDRDWRHPVFPGQAGYVNDPNRHPWRPPANAPRMPVVNIYRRDEIVRPAPINAAPRPAFANDNKPDRRNDVTNRPSRNDSANRQINFAQPAAVAPAPVMQPAAVTTVAPAVNTVGPAAVTAVPPSNRRIDFNRDLTNSNDRSTPNPSRAISFQNPPAASPAPANIATVTAPTTPRSNYPYGTPPTSRVVPAFTGPVISSAPAPVATQPQQMRMAAPAPAPAAAPAPAPAQDKSQSDDRRRGNDNDQKRQQPN